MTVRITGAAPLLVLVACSGASGLLGGGGDGGGDGGSTDDATEGGDDCGSEASGDDGSLGTANGSGGGTAAPWDAAGAPCPDISGAYTQLGWNGVGCGVDNAAYTVCIVLAQQICTFQLVSAQPAPDSGKLAASGVIAVQSDGTFSGASVQLGAVQFTGCTGHWDAGSQTLTVDCGSMSSGQSCVVTMTRTGSTC